MISGIIIATIVVAGVGVAIGLILGVADLKLHVDIDEKEAAILEALPGNNCGGCGYPGCSGCATAIAQGEAAVNQCPVGGAPVAEVISEIMGVKAEKAEEVLAAIKTDKYGKDAAIIGEVIDDDKVLIETGIGGVRILETPIADPVPRVC